MHKIIRLITFVSSMQVLTNHREFVVRLSPYHQVISFTYSSFICLLMSLYYTYCLTLYVMELHFS